MQIVEPSEAKVLKKKAIKEKLLLKGKKLPDGTIRTHGGKKVQKKAGKWVPYSEGKKAEKKPSSKQIREKFSPSKAEGEATTKQKAVAEALSALEKEFGMTGLSPEVNDAMIALRRLLPPARHRQGPRFMAEEKITKTEPKSLVKEDVDFQNYLAMFNVADKEATDDFSKQEVSAVGRAIKSASEITKVDIMDTWEDDHEPCFALQITVADKGGNQTKVPLSLWWFDPATAYKAEGGSKKELSDLLDGLKGDLD